VRTYYDILEDTYLGYRVPPWRKSKNRRLIETEKFYLFDVGVANYLSRRKPQPGTSEFGKSFEHLILMELKAYQAYRDPELEISYWRTSTGIEVDFLVNDKHLAIEVKAKTRVQDTDLRPMFALLEDGPVKKAIIVSDEKEPRRISGKVDVLPWRHFLDGLWSGEWAG
jgi:predicted AAA+ superfamily ATPase